MSSIEIIDPPSPDARTFGIEIAGKITTEDMAAVIERIEQIQADGHKSRILMRMDRYPGVEFGAIWEKITHAGTLWRSLERVAVIGHWKLYESAVRFANPLSPADLRHFGPDGRDQAWAWLAED